MTAIQYYSNFKACSSQVYIHATLCHHAQSIKDRKQVMMVCLPCLLGRIIFPFPTCCGALSAWHTRLAGQYEVGSGSSATFLGDTTAGPRHGPHNGSCVTIATNNRAFNPPQEVSRQNWQTTDEELSNFVCGT